MQIAVRGGWEVGTSVFKQHAGWAAAERCMVAVTFIVLNNMNQQLNVTIIFEMDLFVMTKST